MEKTKPLRVFLMIGLTKESSHWDETFVDQIREKLQPQEIVAFDLPGGGSLFNEKSPASINQIVKRCREHYEHYFNNNDYENMLISISLGGIISVEWMRLFPTDFQKFVVINSSFRGLSPLWKRVQPNAINSFKNIFYSKTVEQREQQIINLCVNNKSLYNKAFDKWVAIAKERPMSRENMLRQTIAAARYKFVDCPKVSTYVIASKHDRLAHYSCSQKIHEKLGGRFDLIEDEKVGHCVYLDAPVELARLIHQWHQVSV